MSDCNTAEQKRVRRLARYERRARARKSLTATGSRIPHGGVIVTRGDVKRHRYLRDRGLPCSLSVAAVALPTRAQQRQESNVSFGHLGRIGAMGAALAIATTVRNTARKRAG